MIDEIKEAAAMYDVSIQAIGRPRSWALTYCGDYDDDELGRCFLVIIRGISSDNGVTAKVIIDTYKQMEPRVGFWPGDIIQYRKPWPSLELIKEVRA